MYNPWLCAALLCKAAHVQAIRGQAVAIPAPKEDRGAAIVWAWSGCVEELLEQCNACKLAGAEAPRLYIEEYADGFGARVLDFIAGMAIAFARGFNFGGVIPKSGDPNISHGVDIIEAVAPVFGLQSGLQLFVGTPPTFVSSWLDSSAFEKGIDDLGLPPPKSNVLIKRRMPFSFRPSQHINRSVASYYTPYFLEELRRGSMLTEQHVSFKPNTISIAIHVRRGDTTGKSKYAQRFVSDRWYFRLVQLFRSIDPDADIHVFSSLEGRWASSDFDGYRSRHLPVHLDGDVTASWAHLVQADVIVTAKSAFSYVPALLNGKCVVYQKFFHKPLPGWIHTSSSVQEPIQSAELEALKKCIHRIGRRTLG